MLESAFVEDILLDGGRIEKAIEICENNIDLLTGGTGVGRHQRSKTIACIKSHIGYINTFRSKYPNADFVENSINSIRFDVEAKLHPRTYRAIFGG